MSVDEAFEGIGAATLAAIGILPDPDADLKADIVWLRSKLEGGSILPAEDIQRRQDQRPRQADGYFKVEDGRPTYVVRSEVFAEWFSSPLRLRLRLSSSSRTVWTI